MLSYVLTQHAVQRFTERVRPGLEYPAAKVELHRLLATFGEIAERPAWHVPDRTAPPNTRVWIRITDDLYAVCADGHPLQVLSVLASGHVSQHTRDRWTAERRAIRAARRYKRSMPALVPS